MVYVRTSSLWHATTIRVAYQWRRLITEEGARSHNNTHTHIYIYPSRDMPPSDTHQSLYIHVYDIIISSSSTRTKLLLLLLLGPDQSRLTPRVYNNTRSAPIICIYIGPDIHITCNYTVGV